MSEPDPPFDPRDPRQLISALTDGDADAARCAQGCDAWAAGEAAVRERWHVYHLIGDVLRNQDLASQPGRDAAFVQRLRERLGEETVVPVLQSDAAPRHRRRAWAAPVAMAAGVAALGAALLVSMSADRKLAPPADAMAGQPAERNVAKATPPASEPRQASSQMLRDARLDRYLRAHREYGAVQPASLPGGAGRHLETVSLER